MMLSTNNWVPGPASASARAFVYHIPGATQSLKSRDLLRMQQILRCLIARACSQWHLSPAYFVRVDAILPEPWVSLQCKNARYWSSDTGMLVRPGEPYRPPPNADTLMAIPASRLEEVKPNRLELAYQMKPDPLFSRLFPGRECPTGLEVYLGSGGCFLYLVSSPGDFTAVAQRTFAADLPPHYYQALEFHVPYFASRQWQSISQTEVERRFSLFDIYMAEVEDLPGIVIASKHDLRELVSEIRPMLAGKA